MENRSDYQFLIEAKENYKHYLHAIEKHPGFVNEFTGYNIESILCQLRNMRWWLGESEKIKKLSADDVLRCEIMEAFEAYLKNDWDSAVYELRDAIAVLERMIDFVRDEEKKTKNKL